MELIKAQPRIIVALGKTAAEILIDGYEMSRRGTWFEWRGKDLIPTWHPAYVLRKPSEVSALQRDIGIAYGGPQQHIQIIYTAPEYEVLHSGNDILKVLDDNEGEVTYDLETNNVIWYDRLDRPANSILMMQFTTEGAGNKGWVIPDDVLYDDYDAQHALEVMFATRKTIGYNAQFDNCFLRNQLGISNARVDFDGICAKYAMDEIPPHGLKPVVFNRYGLPDYEKDLVQKHLKSRNDEYSKVPFEDLAQYGVWDVIATRTLAQDLRDDLVRDGLLEWPFKQILMPAQELLTTMELRGVMVDVPYLRQVQEYMAVEMERLTETMRSMSNRKDLNPNATGQIAEVLWDDLGLPINTKTRVYKQTPRSTAQEAVEHLATFNPKTHTRVREGDPFVDVLMEYRRIAKMQSAYVNNILDFVDINGRVHPSGKVFGTEIGRLSFSDPAIQTIPRPGDKYGAMVRGAFIPSPGNMFAMADFSQGELRMFAALSGSPFLLDAYANDRDIHGEVAAIFYGDNFTKEHRVHAKMFDFAYIYGGNEYSFSRDAGMPLSVATNLVRKFDAAIPEGASYRKNQFKLMVSQGYVDTRFGRRRRAPLITQENADEIRKESVHFPVASSTHDLTLLAAVQLEKEGIPVVMEIHDSIIADVPKEDAEGAAHRIGEVMQDLANKWFPEVVWKTDAEAKSRWSEPPNLSQTEDELI
jgi:DNA polymerase I-like protein with 3'-5' exonuclease and polymerase domains